MVLRWAGVWVGLTVAHWAASSAAVKAVPRVVSMVSVRADQKDVMWGDRMAASLAGW